MVGISPAIEVNDFDNPSRRSIPLVNNDQKDFEYREILLTVQQLIQCASNIGHQKRVIFDDSKINNDIYRQKLLMPSFNLAYEQAGVYSAPNSSLNTPKQSLHRSFLTTIARSRLYASLSSLDRKGKLWSKLYAKDNKDIKKVMAAVAGDHSILTDPRDNRKRQSVLVTRKQGEIFGFTVESYLLKRRDTNGKTMERVSYVDNVELDGAADRAGLRSGHLILSLNGTCTSSQSHDQLVSILCSSLQIRMVVLFEDFTRRIDLSARSIRLSKLLIDKQVELKVLNQQEQSILDGHTRSMSSTCSTCSTSFLSNQWLFPDDDRDYRHYRENQQDSTVSQSTTLPILITRF